MAFRSTSKPWVSLDLGCCASRRDSLDYDEGRAALRANGETEMQICYDQPESVPQPRAEPAVSQRPSTSHSMSRHVSQWVANGRDFATRASSRASVYTLSKPRLSHSKPRPSIGRPMDFRHCEGVDGIQSMLDDAPMPVRRRRSFRPLELSIYLPDGRLSPLPDFAEEEWNALPEKPAQALVRPRDSRVSSLSSEPSTTAYLIQRKPVGSGIESRRSSVQSQQVSRPVSAAPSALPFLNEGTVSNISRPESIISNSNGTLRRSSTQHSQSSTSRLLSRLPSPSRSRSNTISTIGTTTTTRPGSLRRTKTDNNIDEAIRELNTIVEERRASAYRQQSSNPTSSPPPTARHLSTSTHVPAIAPSRVMHVRSETLSDIGSAFSVPLATKPLPITPATFNSTAAAASASPVAISKKSTELRLLPPGPGPLTSNPVTPPSATPTTPIQRFATWLKRSIPPTPMTSTSNTFTQASTSRPITPKSSKSFKSAKSFASPESSSEPLYKCVPESTIPLVQHQPSTRPSTAGSRTLIHTRQESTETATVTLFSTSTTRPSTPTLSYSRSNSPTPSSSPDLSLIKPSSPQPQRTTLKGEGKTRRIPKPLVLTKDDIEVEPSLPSARSGRSIKSLSGKGAILKPPVSPHYGILQGMEKVVSNGRASYMSTGEGQVQLQGRDVGVAF